MFIHHRTQGFVLQKEDRGEADRIFTVFTQDFGKLELLAKAERKIKSKLRSGLELFYLSDVEFIQGKTQKTITDAMAIDRFKSLRNNLLKLSIGYRIAEVFDALVKSEERDEKLWDLLIEVFTKISEGNLKTLTSGLSFYYFLWNFFAILGYGLDLYVCSACQKALSPGNLFFDKKQGGIVCGKCRRAAKSGIDVRDGTIKIIRLFLKKDWSVLTKLKIGQDDLKSIKIFSDYYLREIFDIMSVSEGQGSRA